MGTPLTLHTDRRDDGSTVLKAIGELDLSNVGDFAAALRAATEAASGDAAVRVDLGDVGYLDSGAISVLFEHAASIDLVVNPVLLPVLTISGLTDVVPVAPAPGS